MFAEKKTGLYYCISIPLFLLFLFCTRYSLEFERLWLILSLTSVVVLTRTVFFKKEFYIPTPKIFFTFLVFGILLAINSVLNGSNLLELRWCERFAFIFLVFSFFQLIQEDKKQFVSAVRPAFLFFLYICCLYSLYEYFADYILTSTTSHNVYTSLLRNINMYGQGMCLSLPLVFWLNSQSEQTSKWKWLSHDFLLILISSTCFLSFSRSSILALAIFYVIEIIRPSIQSRKKTLGLLLASLAIFASLNALKNGFTSDLIQGKEKTISFRVALWSKSLQMLKDQPTGIGTGQFKFDLFLYNDGPAQSYHLTDIFTSPHNEFMRFLAEEGLIFGSAYSLFFIFLVLLSLKKIFLDLDKNLNYRFILCLIPEMFFQFPTEIWYSGLLMAFFAAVTLAQDQEVVLLKNKYTHFLLYIGVGISAVFFTGREIRFWPADNSPLYCRFYNDNDRVCIDYFREHFAKKEYVLADQTLQPILKKQPRNFIALAFDYSLGVEPRSQIEACLYYNLFRGNLMIQNDDKKICKLETDRKKLRATFDEFAQKR